jgi:hypothetical protein
LERDSYHPEEVKAELAESGIYLKATHPGDIVREINELYRSKIPSSHKNHSFSRGRRIPRRDYFNPIIAGWLTMNCRLLLSRACVSIIRNGGKVIFMQTDSVAWEGRETDLDKEFWTESKTPGFFEKPEQINQLVSLGAGRYEYTKNNDRFVSKKRGLHLTDLLDDEGAVVSDFSWKKALLENIGKEKIKAKVRVLISPAAAMIQKRWSLEDIGRVIDDEREIDLLVGQQKRSLAINSHLLSNLHREMFYSEPLYLSHGLDGTGTLDYTLPELREMVGDKEFITSETRSKNNRNQATRNYREKNKNKIKAKTKKYNRDYYDKHREKILANKKLKILQKTS